MKATVFIPPLRNPGAAIACLLLVFVFGAASPAARAASAAPGDYMTYQGFLVDANGSPLANSAPANYPVVFRIYNVPTGGSAIWTEQQVVTVDKGQFSVVLGEGSQVPNTSRPPLSTVFTNATASDRYIGITVTFNSSSQEILPRLRLVPSPYAFLASGANKIVDPVSGNVVLSYANSRIEVGGLAFSGAIAGNGAGLTNLSAANLASGTVPDLRLSANVAMRNAANTFSGSQVVNNGNIGVGLGAGLPGFPLSLADSLGDKISLFGASGNTYGFGIQGSLLQIHTDSSGGDVAFGYGSSAAMTETMRIKGSGNVGIGTAAPGSRLEVAGGIRARGGAPGPGGASNNGYAFSGGGGDTDSGMFSSADGQLEFYGNNIERMRIAPNGNVGIGTTSPGDKLSVAGSMSVTGSLKIGPNANQSVVTGGQTLRIIRGRLSEDGTNLDVGASGLGWKSTPTAFGAIITFDPPFPGPPTLTATVGDNDLGFAAILDITSSTATIYTYSVSGLASRKRFHFIAIGLR